jgi:hypothetical protein
LTHEKTGQTFSASEIGSASGISSADARSLGGLGKTVRAAWRLRGLLVYVVAVVTVGI